jgi:hypothetical protein
MGNASGTKPLRNGFVNIQSGPIHSPLELPKKPPLEKQIYTSRLSATQTNLCNDHIYHFRVSESLHVAFGEDGQTVPWYPFPLKVVAATK